MAEGDATAVYQEFDRDYIRQRADVLAGTVVFGGPPDEPWNEALQDRAAELGMVAELHTERCVRAVQTAWRGVVTNARELVGNPPEDGTWSMQVEWCIARATANMHAGAPELALTLLELDEDLADVELRWGQGIMEALRGQAAFLAGDWDLALSEARAAVAQSAWDRTGTAWAVLGAAVGALVAVARDDLELAAGLLEHDTVRHGAVGRTHVGAGHLLLATAELREASTTRRGGPDKPWRALQLRRWAARADADAHLTVHTPLHVASIASLGVPPSRHLPVDLHELRLYVRNHPQPPGKSDAAPLPRAAFDLLHGKQLTGLEQLEYSGGPGREHTGVPYLEARFLEEVALTGAGDDDAAQRALLTYRQLGALRDIRRCHRRLTAGPVGPVA